MADRSEFGAAASTKVGMAVAGAALYLLALWLMLHHFDNLTPSGKVSRYVMPAILVLATTFLLWRTLRAQILITETKVEVRYSILKTHRVDRARITAVVTGRTEMPGGANGLTWVTKYLPEFVLDDGTRLPVLIYSRDHESGAAPFTDLLAARLGFAPAGPDTPKSFDLSRPPDFHWHE